MRLNLNFIATNLGTLLTWKGTAGLQPEEVDAWLRNSLLQFANVVQSGTVLVFVCQLIATQVTFLKQFHLQSNSVFALGWSSKLGIELFGKLVNLNTHSEKEETVGDLIRSARCVRLVMMCV